MTAREFQAEFERRVSIIDPQLKIEEKLTSDTIFSFLNAFTQRYVKQVYLSNDQFTDATKRAKVKNLDDLKGLLAHAQLEPVEDNSDEKVAQTAVSTFNLPSDYFLYSRSNSITSKTYKGEYKAVLPNKLIEQEDVLEVMGSAYNKPIIRQPFVIFLDKKEGDTQSGNNYLQVIHDDYTKIDKLDLFYYRFPKQFNVLHVDNVNILDHCELPDHMHMEIVEGAVEMFITEAKYRLQTKQNNQQ